jgi:hypothetical protein
MTRRNAFDVCFHVVFNQEAPPLDLEALRRRRKSNPYNLEGRNQD